MDFGDLDTEGDLIDGSAAEAGTGLHGTAQRSTAEEGDEVTLSVGVGVGVSVSGEYKFYDSLRNNFARDLH
jgi:hypothetical protein